MRIVAASCPAPYVWPIVQRTFDPVKDQPSEARKLVRQTLQAWGLDNLVDDALQVTAEMVANALLGGIYTVVISDEVSRSVHIAVHDDRPGTPKPTEADDMSTSGRGLLIIRTLADEWGYSDNVVWARFRRG